jgi:drug/metabolite transporter (DMT)-like permease
VAANDVRRAVGLAIAGEGLLTLMDGLIKSLTPRYATFEIAFLRFVMGSLWASALFAWARPGWPSRETVMYNGTRAILAVVTATSFFFALGYLPLAEALAVALLSPLFMALFARLLLHEAVDSSVAGALAAGLAGMAIILAGQLSSTEYSTGAWFGFAAALVSAVVYALVIVLLRHRATRDPLPTIILFQNAGPALLLAVPAWTVWTPPAANDLLLFLGIGFLGVIGHICIVAAFARAEAPRLAPVHYVTLVWGILFGILLFGDYPNFATLAGAALIIAAAVLAQRRGTA